MKSKITEPKDNIIVLDLNKYEHMLKIRDIAIDYYRQEERSTYEMLGASYPKNHVLAHLINPIMFVRDFSRCYMAAKDYEHFESSYFEKTLNLILYNIEYCELNVFDGIDVLENPSPYSQSAIYDIYLRELENNLFRFILTERLYIFCKEASAKLLNQYEKDFLRSLEKGSIAISSAIESKINATKSLYALVISHINESFDAPMVRLYQLCEIAAGVYYKEKLHVYHDLIDNKEMNADLAALQYDESGVMFYNYFHKNSISMKAKEIIEQMNQGLNKSIFG